MMRDGRLSGVLRTEAPACLVEQAVNTALNRDAEELLLAHLGEVPPATLSAEFHRRLKRRGGSHQLERVHAK
jgi:hypothetical protein